MIENLVWGLTIVAPISILVPLVSRLFVGFLIYQFDYIFQVARVLWGHVRGRSDDFVPRGPGERPPILIVLPTLLRNEEELESLQLSIVSAAQNGYPGRTVIVGGIDDRTGAPRLYERLERWAAETPFPPQVSVHVAGTIGRKGKVLAAENALAHSRALVARGEIEALPAIFFNMDADGTLGPRAIERMVHLLTKRHPITGELGFIVGSNVCVRDDHFWKGWRHFFTIDGQLSIQIAREFMVCSGLGRFNQKLFPVVGVPGALYCTWTDLYAQGPRYAAFIRTLKLSHWVKWWFGVAPPRFSESTVAPLPEAMTGPGDDTWQAWLAGTARWHEGRLTLDAPASPLQAFRILLRGYFVQRTIGFDPRARVFTVSPTRPKALWRQRVRWNACRPETFARWWRSHLFHWHIGLPSFLQLSTTLALVGAMVASAVFIPRGMHLILEVMLLTVTGAVTHFLTNAFVSLLALVVDGDPRRNGRKLLALPLASLYGTFFNLLPCVYGVIADFFLFGNWTNFSPEETLVRSKTERPALLYRLRRAFLLAVRSVLHGGVPFGAFWFGWNRTRWTPSGFDGWTSGKRPPPVHFPANEATELRPQ